MGTAAIQIAKAIGARIAVTCSTSKVAACTDLGADLVIDYTQADFADEVAAWTGRQGVDVVLDVIGGDYLARNIASVRVQGRIIQVGVMGEPKATFALGALLPKRAALIGTVLRSRPIEQKIDANQRSAPSCCRVSTTARCVRSSTLASRSTTSPKRTTTWPPTQTSARSCSISASAHEPPSLDRMVSHPQAILVTCSSDAHHEMSMTPLPDRALREELPVG